MKPKGKKKVGMVDTNMGKPGTYQKAFEVMDQILRLEKDQRT